MGTWSEDRMHAMYETLDSLSEICEHRNVDRKDVIALYQACAISRGVHHLHELMLIIYEMAMENMSDKNTDGDEQ